MTSIYDNYGEHAREHLKEEFDPDTIKRDIGWGERDIVDIQKFIKAAKEQIAVIEKITFRRYISFTKSHSHYGKSLVEFSVSVYRVPQVPGNERLKVFEHNDGKRFVGNVKRKEAIEYVRAMQRKYPDAELIGNAVELVKPEKGVVQQ